MEDYAETEWWKKWVLGSAYKSAAPGPEPVYTPEAALVSKRIPDVVVLNAWLWHAVYPRQSGSRGHGPSRDKVLADFEMRVKQFLTALIKQVRGGCEVGRCCGCCCGYSCGSAAAALIQGILGPGTDVLAHDAPDREGGGAL